MVQTINSAPVTVICTARGIPMETPKFCPAIAKIASAILLSSWAATAAVAAFTWTRKMTKIPCCLGRIILKLTKMRKGYGYYSSLELLRKI